MRAVVSRCELPQCRVPPATFSGRSRRYRAAKRWRKCDHFPPLYLVDETQREIGVAALPEFATEEHNPENRLGVRAIEVTASTVTEGLRLLDTPGGGSLNANGPASAFPWLPRCDLGLVVGRALGHLESVADPLGAALHRYGNALYEWGGRHSRSSPQARRSGRGT